MRSNTSGRVRVVAAAGPTTRASNGLRQSAVESTPCRRRPDTEGARERRWWERRALSDRELNANGELVLEDGEWLRQAGLLKIGRFGKDKLRDSNTGRRIERELGRDQRGVAWRIRLNVELRWKPHLQCGAGRSGASFRFDERRQLGARTAKLRPYESRLTTTTSSAIAVALPCMATPRASEECEGLAAPLSICRCGP